MKNKRQLFFLLFCFVSLSINLLDAQDIVEKASFDEEKANFELINPNSYLLEIAGPNGYYFKENLANTNQISIANTKSDGTKFGDGLYQMQVTPVLELTDIQRKELAKLRAEGNVDKIQDYRLANNLPESVSTYSVYFSIKNGDFVRPDQKEFGKIKMPSSAYTWEQDHPAMYASLNNVLVDAGQTYTGQSADLATDRTAMSAEDQVFLDDVIVDGSICVGMDCVNGESFGFDTQRIKENNLRIHFDDTSSSASFPSNDWRISINDSSNGGSNYFAVEDATAGTTPFRVEAGAGNNALHVDASGGNVGMGTATPVVEVHVADGDSPTMRLEQNGANGWTPQTWDIAGNETNFFVRDVTNGSKLPFKIKPGAPDNSIYIDAEGDIGIGTANPGTNGLQLENGDMYVKAGNVGINKAPSTKALDVLGDASFTGSTLFTGDVSYFLTSGASFLGPSFMTAFQINADATGAKIGVNLPFGHTIANEFEVCGTIAASNATVQSLTCSSDNRLKKNVETLSGSLDKLKQLRGVSFNWKTDEFPNRRFSESDQLGFIAQEVQLLFPELVETNADGYKAVAYSKLTPVLVEAIKEQQEIIDQQQKEINELRELKAQMASLTQMVSELKQESTVEVEEVIGEKK